MRWLLLVALLILPSFAEGRRLVVRVTFTYGNPAGVRFFRFELTGTGQYNALMEGRGGPQALSGVLTPGQMVDFWTGLRSCGAWKTTGDGPGPYWTHQPTLDLILQEPGRYHQLHCYGFEGHPYVKEMHDFLFRSTIVGKTHKALWERFHQRSAKNGRWHHY